MIQPVHSPYTWPVRAEAIPPSAPTCVRGLCTILKASQWLNVTISPHEQCTRDFVLSLLPFNQMYSATSVYKCSSHATTNFCWTASAALHFNVPMAVEVSSVVSTVHLFTTDNIPTLPLIRQGAGPELRSFCGSIAADHHWCHEETSPVRLEQ